MKKFAVLQFTIAYISIISAQTLEDLISDLRDFSETGVPNWDPNYKDIRNCTCVPVNNCKQPDSNAANVCKNKLETCCPPLQVTEETVGSCGIRNFNGVLTKFNVSTDTSQFGEFPWMVAVFHKEMDVDQSLKVYHCGGALIHPQVVLTGAHCVKGELAIRAGEWDSQSKSEPLKHQDRSVKTVIIHPEYYSKALFNDVALLILEKPLDLAPNVDVICLPPKNVVLNGDNCVASAWGKGVSGQDLILKKHEYSMINSEKCQAEFRKTRLGNYFILHKSFICASVKNDFCSGDGGSPLICPIAGSPGKYYQAGIVAWGIECSKNGIPSVHVNVPLFRDWIDQKMTENGFTTNTYTY